VADPAEHPSGLTHLVFTRIPYWILGSLMLAGIAIIFANVVGRYVFGYALFWAEETLVYLTIWGVGIGLAAVTFNGDHLNMDLFSSRLRGRAKTLLDGLVMIVFVVCFAFVIRQSYQVVTLFMQSGAVSVSAGIPKAIPHAALLIGFVLALLAAMLRFWNHLKGKD
jgi:TRAP-type C4-dicarboxylate transport system permease small subunit